MGATTCPYRPQPAAGTVARPGPEPSVAASDGCDCPVCFTPTRFTR